MDITCIWALLTKNLSRGGSRPVSWRTFRLRRLAYCSIGTTILCDTARRNSLGGESGVVSRRDRVISRPADNESVAKKGVFVNGSDRKTAGLELSLWFVVEC
jgi:hypothetical protein